MITKQEIDKLNDDLSVERTIILIKRLLDLPEFKLSTKSDEALMVEFDAKAMLKNLERAKQIEEQVMKQYEEEKVSKEAEKTYMYIFDVETEYEDCGCEEDCDCEETQEDIEGLDDTEHVETEDDELLDTKILSVISYKRKPHQCI